MNSIRRNFDIRNLVCALAENKVSALEILREALLADVNYTLPSATITSPHPRHHLSTPGGSCRPSKSSR